MRELMSSLNMNPEALPRPKSQTGSPTLKQLGLITNEESLEGNKII